MTGRVVVRAAGSYAEGLGPEVSLVTIPGVELLEVGEDWETSTGTFTFTEEDLASAVACQDDPAIRTPIIKLGHTDPRFDGQPSLGRILNLRTTNNNQTLVGDLVGLPAWLAATMASAYPRRSIEGFWDANTRTGNNWKFCLTGVALLGEAYPAVNTLEDVAALWGTTAPVMVPAADVEPVLASTSEHFVASRRDNMPRWKTVAAGATSFADLPLADRDASWSASGAKSNVRDWASSDGSGDTDKIDWSKFRKAFFWYDADNPEVVGSYKLPFADVVDGKLKAIPRGVFAAAGRYNQADVPDDDLSAVENHMEKYYTKMASAFDDDSITPPWKESTTASAPNPVAAATHTHLHSHGGGEMHSHAHTHASGKYNHGDGSDTPHEHAHGADIAASAPVRVRAAVSVEDLRRGYYDSLSPVQMWWWIREIRVDPPEIIVDDDEGSLFQVSYTVGADGTVVFGDPVQVQIEYVAVAASKTPIPLSSEGQIVAAKYGDAKASGRPDREGHTPPVAGAATLPDNSKEDTLKLTDEVMQRLGLTAESSEDEVNAAILASVATPGDGNEGDKGAGDGTTTPPAGSTDAQPPAGGEAPAATPPAATPTVPEGMVLVDEAQWAQVQEGVAAALAMRTAAEESERSRLLDDAVKAGKFPPARREHYATLLKADPDGTRTLLASMAPGLVPVGETGYVGGDDTDQQEASRYPASWERSVKSARRASATSTRVHTVGD